MASTTLSIITTTLAGSTVTPKTSVASSETLTIQATTAQSIIDFSTVVIRVENTSTTASVTLSLAAGTEYSEIGQGAYTVTVGTAETIVIGGQGFESARFQSSANTLVFTQTGAGTTSWEAFQYPRVTE